MHASLLVTVNPAIPAPSSPGKSKENASALLASSTGKKQTPASGTFKPALRIP
jgi:hypothetical protein